MRKSNFLKSLCLAALVSFVSVNAGAQDLKSILTGVAKAVIGDKATTESSIVGTWTYVGPECQFESDNLLSQAGGEVAAKEVEEKLQGIYTKVGMEGCQYTFNADSTYSYTVKKRTTRGTYVFDNDKKTITMRTRLGIKSVAHVTVTGGSMSLVFNADKLMTVLKTLSGSVSKVNSTASALNSIAGSFDGLMLGFELKKKE